MEQRLQTYQNLHNAYQTQHSKQNIVVFMKRGQFYEIYSMGPGDNERFQNIATALNLNIAVNDGAMWTGFPMNNVNDCSNRTTNAGYFPIVHD